MNLTKIQIELLKQLTKDPELVSYEPYDEVDYDSWVIVPTPPAVAFVIDKYKCRVDLEGCSTTNVSELIAWDPKEAEELVPTDEYRLGGTARKYLYAGDVDRPVYLDVKKLKFFENPVLKMNGYTTKAQAVTVYEYAGVDELVVVGLVAAMKVDNEENKERI